MATKNSRRTKKPTTAPQKVAGLGRLKAVQIRFSRTIKEYLSRRPHRSFRRTMRRDYQRSLALPGYWAFTFYVGRILVQNRRLFIGLVIFYAIIGAIFTGLSSQDAYAQLSGLLDETGGGIFDDGWKSVGQAGLLIASALSGSLTPQLTEAQQIYSVLILLLTWLTTVWLLRSILAGHKPRLRDGLYSGGSPIVATGIVFLILLIQLLPATLAVIVVNSATATNLFENGFIAMLISIVAALLFMLTIYWAAATVLAMIIVTLPGMYPWQAIRTAGDMAIGRRVRILLRIAWMVLTGLIGWIVVVLPAVILVRSLTKLIPSLDAVPIIPVIIACVSSVIVIWSATYVYLLYRKIVEDDAKPA